MSDILHSPYGLSVRRNGSCLRTETDCGTTWSSFHACCPHGTFCPSGQDNVKCCPSDADCSKLIENTHCANSTANVYKANLYFCCADGSSAFMQKNGYVGCTEDISELDGSSTLLSIRYHATHTATSTSPSSTSSSDSTGISTLATSFASPTPTSDADDVSSSSRIGAITGGVIGGVAGLAILAATLTGGLVWFIRRRRARNEAAASGVESQYKSGDESDSPGRKMPYFSTPGGSESKPKEIDDQQKYVLHDLPSHVTFHG